MLDYYNDVLRRVQLEQPKHNNKFDNNKPKFDNSRGKSVASVKDIKRAVASGQDKKVTVPLEVLATMLNHTKRKGEEVDKTKSVKGPPESKKPRSEKKEVVDKNTKPCFAFAKNGKCDYGDRCYFLHNV